MGPRRGGESSRCIFDHNSSRFFSWSDNKALPPQNQPESPGPNTGARYNRARGWFRLLAIWKPRDSSEIPLLLALLCNTITAASNPPLANVSPCNRMLHDFPDARVHPLASHRRTQTRLRSEPNSTPCFQQKLNTEAKFPPCLPPANPNQIAKRSQFDSVFSAKAPNGSQNSIWMLPSATECIRGQPDATRSAQTASMLHRPRPPRPPADVPPRNQMQHVTQIKRPPKRAAPADWGFRPCLV